MYLNRLTLIGFIGGDAEMKIISSGSTFTAFSVATQRLWKNSEGA
jgi:single-stranded DNA-binding protein